MPIADRKTDQSACSPTQHGNGIASSRCRSICDRALARARIHRDHANVHACRFAPQRKSPRAHRRSIVPAGTVQARRHTASLSLNLFDYAERPHRKTCDSGAVDARRGINRVSALWPSSSGAGAIVVGGREEGFAVGEPDEIFAAMVEGFPAALDNLRAGRGDQGFCVGR